MTNKLLILSPRAHTYEKLIKGGSLPDLEISTATSVDQVHKNIDQSNILLAAPDLAYHIIPKLKNLQWVQSTWAGVNRLMGQECRKDYLLTGVKGVFGPIMSEYVFCYILMHARNVFSCYSHQKEKQWEMPIPGLLRGKKLGVMGVGSIGSTIAKTGQFFNMITYGFAKNTAAQEGIDRMFSSSELLGFVSDVDYLVSVLPQTPHTDSLINADTLQAMKPEAVLINVGRGNVVDETALIDALNNKQIAGAVLDVFQQEPLAQDHPLWTTPGVIITSHKAALTYPDDVAPLFIENYHHFTSGKQLRFIVDFTKGY
jgi:phosphoglycerate dehydrogenase-like enzyme